MVAPRLDDLSAGIKRPLLFLLACHYAVLRDVSGSLCDTIRRRIRLIGTLEHRETIRIMARGMGQTEIFSGPRCPTRHLLLTNPQTRRTPATFTFQPLASTLDSSVTRDPNMANRTRIPGREWLEAETRRRQ